MVFWSSDTIIVLFCKGGIPKNGEAMFMWQYEYDIQKTIVYDIQKDHGNLVILLVTYANKWKGTIVEP